MEESVFSNSAAQTSSRLRRVRIRNLQLNGFVGYKVIFDRLEVYFNALK